MKEKAVVYPSKTTLNLCMKEKSSWRPGRVIPTFTALALAVVLFGKFAVADRLAQVSREQQVLSGLTAQVQALEKATADYDAVLEEYGRYSVGWMTDEEKAAVDRVGVLDLIEAELMSAASVQQFSIAGNVLSLSLAGVTLEDTSRIVQRLYTWPQVTGVSVYTASTQQQQAAEEATVSMVVTLAPAEEGGEA